MAYPMDLVADYYTPYKSANYSSARTIDISDSSIFEQKHAESHLERALNPSRRDNC